MAPSTAPVNPSSAAIGPKLKHWREQRRLSQLALASDARISARHLSFIETGRSRPSRGMVLHLAELLDVPLRERNGLLLSAGYAPAFSARGLEDRALSAAMSAVDLVLKAHGAFPAIAVDRYWNLLRANRAAQRLMHRISPELLVPPINVLRATLHPNGLAPTLINHGQLREHLLSRLLRQARVTGDAVLARLHAELEALPFDEHEAASQGAVSLDTPDAEVVVPMRLRTPYGELGLFSTITVFGTPNDVTLSELAIEAFFPSDDASRKLLEQLAAADNVT